MMKMKKEILQKFLNEKSKVLAIETGKALRFSAEKIKASGQAAYENINPEPLSSENWYGRAAFACERLADAILQDEGRTSKRVKSIIAGKLGFAGTSASIFSLASILGTASTGTAIGGLSGASFTSSALAWVGGSVFIGTLVVGAASIVGSFSAIAGVKWVSDKYLYGPKKKSDLSVQEERILAVCMSLAVAFRKQEEDGNALSSLTASALHEDALQPLCTQLTEYWFDFEKLPPMQYRRLDKAVKELKQLSDYLSYWLKGHSSISIGIVSAVLLQLLADDFPEFTEHERLVLESLQRSNGSLAMATDEELSAYVKEMDPRQIMGLHNNIKGIYHEKRFALDENSNGDEYLVELFEATNHPGSDVRIINTITGDVKEVQLKATNYLSYVQDHNARYEDIAVFATTEVAELSDDISSTGLSNADLNKDVSSVFDELKDYEPPEMLTSMSVAAIVTLARNARVLLNGEKMKQKEQVQLIEDGVVSAGTAGLVHLLIG